MNIKKGIKEWKDILGDENVITDSERLLTYTNSTMQITRAIEGALIVRGQDDVAKIVQIALKNRVPLYPISTGNNWGYGNAVPLTDGCVIVDLSKLTKITMDTDLGIVTVEPGVTQGMLADYLEKNAIPYMVPVTGAGPSCSILGNALERGYGITPYGDHWGAVTRLRAILPDGSVYENALTELGAFEVAHIHKWGLGPNLDALFCQGAFGIVTEMSIRLKRIPEKMVQFLFDIEEEDKLMSAMHEIQLVMQSLEGVVSGINFMNGRRILAMTEPRMREFSVPGKILTDAQVAAMLKERNLQAWSCLGALYGDREVVQAGIKVIRRRLKPSVKRLVFFSPETLARTERILRMFRFIPFCNNIHRITVSLREGMRIFQGIPTQVALPLAYFRSGKSVNHLVETLNPKDDRCGIIWFSPLLPMKDSVVRAYLKIVKTVCERHMIEPLITLTTISNSTLDCTVPILFDLSDKADAERARECHDELLSECKKIGLFPYRLGIHSMGQVTDNPTPFWKLVQTLKKSIDPHNIIAPGRYTPHDNK